MKRQVCRDLVRCRSEVFVAPANYDRTRPKEAGMNRNRVVPSPSLAPGSKYNNYRNIKHVQMKNNMLKCKLQQIVDEE